jgi:hypothetical protein
MEFGFLFVDAAHVTESGPTMEHAGELVERILWTHGVDFDPSVVQIRGISGQVKGGGGVLREVTVTHTLYAAADKPPAGCF